MNLKALGILLIIISLATYCFGGFRSQTIQNVSSLQTFVNLISLTSCGMLLVGICLVIYSSYSEKQKYKREVQSALDQRAKKESEKQQKEDEIIEKWLKKSSESDRSQNSH